MHAAVVCLCTATSSMTEQQGAAVTQLQVAAVQQLEARSTKASSSQQQSRAQQMLMAL